MHGLIVGAIHWYKVSAYLTFFMDPKELIVGSDVIIISR